MKKSLIIVVLLLTALICFSSCKQTKDDNEFDYQQYAIDYVDNLLSGNYQACTVDFNNEMLSALSVDSLHQTWEQTIISAGDFEQVEKIETATASGYQQVSAYCKFSKNGIKVTISFDQDNKVAGLFFSYYNPDQLQVSLPDGLEEIDVTLNQGSNWELAGKITRQSSGKSTVAAVLVHGSGPSDMDESIYANKPFRDIAWGLAEQGVDVLRYDKRTYSYASEMAEMKSLTVREETIDDAIAAGQLLREQGYRQVYIIGHSLGGMLAPRIEQQSGGIFSGLIILAGSPRRLTDIIIDQNEAVIAGLNNENEIARSRRFLTAEKEKLAQLPNWNEAELAANTVFGMPAYYVKDFQSYDTAEIAQSIDKPFLILQGDNDVQVSSMEDYNAWKTVLAANRQAEYFLYPGLNHLFMPSQCSDINLVIEEYQIAANVDQQVIDDMAEFIKEH